MHKIALIAALIYLEDLSSSNEPQTLDSDEQNRQVVISYTDVLSVQNIQGTWGTANPPHVSPYNNLVISADLLYVVAQEDNLNFASKINADNPNLNSKGTLYDPHFRWDWGSRVAIGYLFDKFDNWDLYLDWTYVHGRGKNTVSTPDDFTAVEPIDLYPTWGGSTTLNGIAGGFFVNDSQAEGILNSSVSWMLNLNLIDLDLRRSFYIGKKVTLHPFAGLRGAFIDQDYTVHYVSKYHTFPVLTSAPSQMKAKNDFKGLGFHGGFNFLWHFSPNWGVNAQVAGSLLYGTFHVRQDYQSQAFDFIEPDTLFLHPSRFKTRRNLHQACTNLEGSLGIYWETSFNKQKNHILLGLSYELAEWFDQNQMTRPFFDVSHSHDEGHGSGPALNDTRYNTGDLSYAGASFRMRFDF